MVSAVQLKTYPIILGKNGINDDFIQHVKAQLKQHRIVKIKVLKNSGLGVQEAVDQLLPKTNGKVLKKIGRTFILTK